MALSKRTVNINVATATTDSVLLASQTFGVAPNLQYARIGVLGFVIVTGTGVAGITFNSKGGGAGTAISSTFVLAASTSLVATDTDGWPYFITNAGEALTLTTGATTTNVTGFVQLALM